jgi:hypothetical protein
MWLSWNEVFCWRQTLARPSVGRNKKTLSSDQWTRLHMRIVHPKWSCDQTNRAWRWCNVNWTFYGAHIPWWWRRLITVCEAVGMHIGGFSHIRVADHFRVNHSIIVRLMQRFRQTGNAAHIPWWWRRLITVCVLMWPPNAELLRSAPAVLNGRCRARLDMSRSSWRRAARSTTDGCARVWRQQNTSFQDNHILGTTAFGGGGVTVWNCFSFDCKLDLYVLDGNKVPYLLYRVHVWRHSRLWNCLNSLLL